MTNEDLRKAARILEAVSGDYGHTNAVDCTRLAAGHHLGETQRHMVNHADGSTIRPNGFRKCHPIRKDVGRWLLTVAADELERSKPCTVNLWTMLTPSAFDLELDTE